MTVWQWVRSMHNDELQCGQGLLEYALVLILVSILLIVMLMFFSDEISGLYELIIDRLDAVFTS